LHVRETAGLWKGFFACSHFDGVRKWPYPGSDRASAQQRLALLDDRPVFICGEGNQVEETRLYLQEAAPGIDATYASTGFRNHSDAWILRPGTARDQARAWLTRTIAPPPPE
jgi:hypothetical protein